MVSLAFYTAGVLSHLGDLSQATQSILFDPTAFTECRPTKFSPALEIRKVVFKARK